MTIENNIDEMVLKTQEWLNRNYVTKYGYTPIEENGHTGWSTIIALTTALQIELGISEPTGNFGPQTSSNFKSLSMESNPSEGDTSPEAYSIQNQIYIIQGALWCKGYSPGGFTGYFGEETKNAIIQMQTDAGLSNPDGIVDVVIMKALLSMDAFKLLEYLDNVDPKIREIQQALNRDYISNSYFKNDLGLIPCDGLYGRKTNQALVYALQIEEGISEPTGYFGPATKENIPYLTLGTENKFVTLLQYSLYCNGKEFDPTGFTGYYGEGTQAAVLKFQEFTCLDQSGNAGLQTWSSLLISTGDDTRKGIACDCSTTLTTEKANTLKENGYSIVGRYLTGKYALSNDELSIIINAGLSVFPIFETGGFELLYFNKYQGIEDARISTKVAKELGFKENTIIYFGVDFDVLNDEVTSRIIPYFQGINEEFQKIGSPYKVGIYAPRNACTRVNNSGYSCSSFVCDMSTGFSGNLGYSLPKDWAFDQISTISLGEGDGLIEIDNNISSGKDIGSTSINPVEEQTSFECLVLSGKEENIPIVNPRYKFNFIEPALKKLKEYIDSKTTYYNNSKITWIIEKNSYSDSDLDKFKSSANKLGINIVLVASKEELFNYINTGDILGETNRTIKIKEFTLFGHGYPGKLDFAKDYEINIADLSSINSNSFIDTVSVFYSCNTATNNTESFAYKWKEVVGGIVHAVVNKTEYSYMIFRLGYDQEEEQLIDKLRSDTGYIESGSFAYPCPADDDNAYWIMF